MVGDSEVDIATATAASVPSIAVTFGYTPRPVREFGPGAVIDHYREFMPALAKVLPGRCGKTRSSPEPVRDGDANTEQPMAGSRARGPG